jgi:hypothetical protein
MDDNHIIGVFNRSSMASTWTEYLCMEVSPNGSVTLTSKSREVLTDHVHWTSNDVVWPEGFDPNDENCDEQPWPVSIDGTEIVACEDGIYLGDDLGQHSDGSSATFKPGETEAAEQYVEDDQGSAEKATRQD